jgi:hypothetical protein
MPATTEVLSSDSYRQRCPPSSAQDLRALGKLVVDSIEIYLASLSREGLPPPDFAPESKTIIPNDPVGQEAQRTLLSTAERIVGLVSGPAGLYGLSRQVSLICLLFRSRKAGYETNLFITMTLLTSLGSSSRMLHYK